jgi:hypothetical protein
LAGLATLLLLAGCAHEDPVRERLKALNREIREAADAGSLALRCNPVGCDCPAFEVRVGERWVRVEVVDSADPERPIEALREGCAAGGEGIPGVLSVPVVVESKAKQCGNGTTYFEVSLAVPQ